MAGVTVIVQGPQGEDATVTDAKGVYQFSSLAVGTYVAPLLRRQHVDPGRAARRHRLGREDRPRERQDRRRRRQAAAQQTYVITGKAPTIDVGSARLGTTFDEDFTLNVPVEPNYGAVISKAPGAFVDGSGNVSIGGATGLENIYIVNGMNVTGLRYGNLEAGARRRWAAARTCPPSSSRRSTSTAAATRPSSAAPSAASSTPSSRAAATSSTAACSPRGRPTGSRPTRRSSRSSAARSPAMHSRDFDDRIGFEVGGPLIKDKLFFWVGFAPQITDIARAPPDTYAQNGMAWHGAPTRRSCRTTPSASTRRAARTPTPRRSTTSPSPSTSSSSPSSARRASTTSSLVPWRQRDRARPSPVPTATARRPGRRSQLTKTNTDVVGALDVEALRPQVADRGASRGFHNEYFNDRSPSDQLNHLNQLQYWSNDLGTLENLPGCEPARVRALPREPLLLDGRLRPDHEVHGQPLVGRAQVDAPVRGWRPPRAQVRLAPRACRPST